MKTLWTVVLGAGLAVGAARGQNCEQHFEGVGTLDSTVAALGFFDLGDGVALYASGGFTSTNDGPAMHIARWSGSAWSALGEGVDGGGVEAARALAVYDDGSGLGLYAGGALTLAGGQTANHIARWDGEAWTTLGEGTDNVVRALAVFDEDGDGPGAPALFAGGTFLNAGGQPAVNIARWNGEAWSAVGGGVDQQDGLVRGLRVFDDGSGPALFATGTFVSIGGVSANNIAKWDGQAWAALGDGLTGGVGIALEAWDDGTGLKLFAGGTFTAAGGQPAL
jgi:hypothetical protein